VNDEAPPLGIDTWAPFDWLYPSAQWSGIVRKSLKLEGFLARTVLVLWGQVVSVRDLIDFIANLGGGVHLGVAKTSKERALADFRAGSLITPGGQFSTTLYPLFGVSRIVLDALQPLREAVAKDHPSRGWSRRLTSGLR
jgi:hypothetical protein